MNATNANLRAEIVSQGVMVTLVLAETNFTLTIPDPRVPLAVTIGSWTSSQDVIRLSPAGMPFSIEFDFTRNGNDLRLDRGRMEFDFDANGSFEQAIVSMTLTRQ